MENNDAVPYINHGLQTAVSVAYNLPDVLMVAMSEAETHIDDMLKSLRQNAEQMRKQLQAQHEELADALNDFGNAQVNGYLQPALASLVALGFTTDSANNKEITHEVFTEIVKGKIIVKIHIIRISAKFPVEFDIPKNIQSILNDLDALEKAIAAVTNEALEWKMRQSNLPKLERQYRAKLVKEQLSSTASGKDILKAMTDDLDRNIRNLV